MSVEMTDSSSSRPPTVGIFAIQGSVAEHADCIRKCGGIVKEVRGNNN